jgi:hypothetical protein
LAKPTKLNASPDARIVIGYHGTSSEIAKANVNAQKMPISRNVWDWLGDGAYFWEDSFERAVVWARQKYKDEASIIRAGIRLGRCLDLFDARWAPALGAAFEKFAAVSETKGLPLPVNKGGNHALDRAVINCLCEEVYEIDTVRGPFIEGPPVFAGSLLPNLAHVQVAVRNLDSILLPIEIVYPFPSEVE